MQFHVTVFRNKLNLFYIFSCFVLTGIFISYFSSNRDEFNAEIAMNSTKFDIAPSHSSHTLCIIVPFRNRLEELLEFVPHISKFLSRQHISFYINIINQDDEYRFNRGSLMNVGFRVSTKIYESCDYIALHDVDLLPLNENISYAYPGNSIFHPSSAQYHPLYNNPSMINRYIGGITLISNANYIAINGFSNKYWGWGTEDTEFYARIRKNSITINRPTGLSTDTTNTFRHFHKPNRIRDGTRCHHQVLEYLQADRVTGLKDVNYSVSSVHTVTIDDFPVTLYNVNLHCDLTVTPWCVCPGGEKNVSLGSIGGLSPFAVLYSREYQNKK